MKPKKIPTDEEYNSYNGEYCFRLWAALNEQWRCPGCNRSKREILRWTKRYLQPQKGIHKPYFGWMAGLHTHHDHSAPFLSGNGRFPDTVICDHCNSADGVVKRKLQLPDNFSFSPSEIKEFITAKAYDSHKVDFEKAKGIYEHLETK